MTRAKPAGLGWLTRPLPIAAGFTVAAVLLATIAFASARPASAASNGAWAVEPTAPEGSQARSNFTFDVSPGQTLDDSVAISNFTDRPLTFDIYPADAYNTPVDAAFALRGIDEPRQSVGSWLRLEVGRFEVPPGTRVDVPFTIVVPDDASPGDHIGGIVAANTEIEGQLADDELGVGIKREVGTRVYARVDGPVEPALKVESVSMGHNQPIIPYLTGRGSATVEYEVVNTGNVRLTPEATVTIKGLFGRTVKTFESTALPELLPGGSTIVTVDADGLPSPDKLTATVTAEADDVSTTGSTSVWAVPWLLLAALVLLAGGWWWWRRRRRPSRRVDTHVPPTLPTRSRARV